MFSNFSCENIFENLPKNNIVVFIDDNGEIVDSIYKKKSPYEAPMKTIKRYSVSPSLPSIIEYHDDCINNEIKVEIEQSKSCCFLFWWWKKV